MRELTPFTQDSPKGSVDPYLNEAQSVQEETGFDPASINVRAELEANILGVDPLALATEMQANNGTHAMQQQVSEVSKHRAGVAMRDFYEGLRSGKIPVTKDNARKLRDLHAAAKGDVTDEYFDWMGARLSDLDKYFTDNPAPVGNKQAAKVDAARKAALQEKYVKDYWEVRRRVVYKEADSIMRQGLDSKTREGQDAESQERYSWEALSLVLPVVGTAESLTLPVAMSAAYTELTGHKLTKQESLNLGDTFNRLRGVIAEVEKLPAEKREAELTRIYRTIFTAARKIGVTQGRYKTVVDIIPALEEKVETYNIGGMTFTSDDLYNAGTVLEATLGMIGGASIAKHGVKALRGHLAKYAVDRSLKGKAPLPTPKENLSLLRPPPMEGSIGQVVRGLSVPDVIPNPLGGMRFTGNTGISANDLHLAKLEQQVNNAKVMLPGKLFTNAEQDAMWRSVVEKIKEAGGEIRPEYSEIVARSDEGFRMSALIGSSGKSGWASGVDALYYAMDAGLPLNESKLVRRDLVTGEFEELTGDALKNTNEWLGKPGEYFVKTDSFYKYNPEDRKLFGVSAPVQVAMGGAMTRALLDPASRFSKQMMDYANTALGKGFAFKDAANSILKSNFLKLHGESRAKVMKVLEDGDAEQIDFDYSTLTTRYPDLSEKEAKAYFEARAFNQLLYQTANKQARDVLDAGGWKAAYKLDDAAIPSIVRPARSDGLPNMIFDPRSNKLITREEAQATNLDIVELRTPADVPTGGTYTHRLVTTDEIYDALPPQVLNYNPGQITRIYDENWYVRVSKKEVVNGEVVQGPPRVVAVAGTKKEADDAVAQLQSEVAEGSDLVYETTRDEKALRALSQGSYEFDVQGALLTSQRREEALPRVGGGKARTLDPFNAMNVARDVVANREAWSDYMRSMRELVRKQWPDHVMEDANGNIVMAQGAPTDDQFEQANQFVQWLQAMQSGEQDAMIFKQNLVRISARLQDSNKIPDFVADPMARVLNNVPAVDPLKWARSSAFMLQVAMGGPRAVVMSALQPLFLVGLSPVKALRAMATDQWALHLAMHNRDNPKLDEMLAKYLKAAGLGEGDVGFYKAAMEAYRLSGLPYSVESHAFFRGSDFSPELKSTDGAAAEIVKGMVSALPRVASTVFRAGEQMNLASTFMVAARRYKAKNPKANWGDSRVWSQISADARNLALNMTKTNDLSYQRGWWAVPLQYIAITHKAATLMLANKSLTAGERGRVVLGSLAVYGANGFPYGPELVQEAMDMADIDLSAAGEEATNVRNYVYGGLMDGTFNRWVFNDDDKPGSVAVASSASMANGVKNMLEASLGDDATFLKVMTGAVGSTYTTFGRVATEVETIMQRPDLSDSEKTMKALAVLPEISSGWSRFVKAQMGVGMSATVSNNFKPMVRQTEVENWARGTFGFGSYREAETHILRKNKEEIDEETKEFMDATARQMIRILSKYNDDYPAARKELLDMQNAYAQSDYHWQVWRQAVKSVLIPAQGALKSGMKKDEYDKMLDSVIKGIQKDMYKAEDYKTAIYNSDGFLKLPAEEQEKIRKLVEDQEYQLERDTFGDVEETE